VQEISIVSRTTLGVVRLDGSAFVFLEFEGLRESRTIVDNLTRIRVTLPLAEATRLQELLARRLML
jgi:hypothetical protein